MNPAAIRLLRESERWAILGEASLRALDHLLAQLQEDARRVHEARLAEAFASARVMPEVAA